MFFKLNNFSKKIYSQFGEDGIIERIISTSKIPISKYIVDVGAYDGITNSNTYNLFITKKIEGLVIEPNENNFEKLNKLDFGKSNIQKLKIKVSTKGVNSIDEIVKKYLGKDIEIGYLSIDIQSYDYYLLKYLKIRPQIISIEFNPSIPPYIDYYDPEDSIYLKCSAKAIERLANKKNYKLICCTPNNAFLIRNDCFNNEFHPNAPVEFLFDYEGLLNNNNGLYTIIHSNPYTTYPISTKPLNFLDKYYFKFTRRLFSFLKIRKEKYLTPNNEIKKLLKKSKLFYK